MKENDWLRERGGNVLVGGGSERDVIMTKVVKRIKATGVHHQHTLVDCQTSSAQLEQRQRATP